MSRTDRIAISLPKQVLDAVERVRHQTGETRSGLIQRAIRQMLEGAAKSTRVRQYVEGYARDPEGAAEVRAAEASAARLLAQEPWE